MTSIAADGQRIERLVSRTGYPLHIAGEWLAGQGDDVIAVINPATGAPLASLVGASGPQVENAVISAERALSGPWRATGPAQRSRVLHALTDLVEENADELAELAVLENGTPVSQARGSQVGGAIAIFRWFAEAAARGPIGGYEVGLPIHDGPPMSASILRREPAGVVAAITAYNFPLFLAARKIGGAIAAGCSTVLMPSERAPLTTLRLMELIERLGLPPGVVNLVVGSRGAGQVLSTHPAVDVVSFTGSVGVGSQIMAQAAGTTKKVVLELGGKSAAIVLPGADLETLIKPATDRYIVATGQACGCTTRTFVPQSMYADYISATQEYFASSVCVGDPADPRTTMGPLIRADQRTLVEGFVDRAVAEGGQVVAGGGRPDGLVDGFFVNPMLIGGVGNGSEIAQNELFGPVGIVMPYDEVADAVELANESRYGLSAAVWGPTDRAMDVARQLRTGNVLLNGGGGFRPDMPWGGPGLSGTGRESGEEGFLEYFETKHIQWPMERPG